MMFFKSQPTVLLVEDEVMVRQQMAETLTESGMTVFQASNADEAMTHIRQTPAISVVVTDIDLQGAVDGIELAGLIRKDYKGKIKIIMISGTILPGMEDIDNYLPKPCSADELLEAITTR